MRKLITAAVAILLSVGGLAYAQNRDSVRSQVRVGGPKLDLAIDGETLAQAGETWSVTGDVVINVNGVQLVADRAVVTAAARQAGATGQTGEVVLEGNVRLILRKP